jgi:D-glycero-D-manno-heptose 1,7-bisphosphate phosphatase
VNKAAFIDRDGVINEDRAYVHRIADFAFIPGSVEALRALHEAGYLLVVITNQSGIARGLFSEAEYRHLEEYFCTSLSRAGVQLDSIQYCPHLPDAPLPEYRLDCDCRKPRPGMLLAAVKQLDIDLSQSILVGDRRADVEAGRAAGVSRCFLVRSGQPLCAADEVVADAVFDDLAHCARHVRSQQWSHN